MAQLQLKWKTCGPDGHWCDLKNLQLENNTDQGVYIIWHVGNPSRVVRVGQGSIKDRLAAHRKDPKILQYGQLRVTWAVVETVYRGGVERHLANAWNPLVGDSFPNVSPISVNSPFAA